MSKTTFGTNIGHLRLDSYVLASIVQLGTQHFCEKFLTLANAPKGRQYDQMTQATRSVVANIAEGAARHFTSYETEMKLTDVARASLAELAADYTNWLMRRKLLPWRKDSPEAQAVLAILLDKADYEDTDLIYASCRHILAQQEKFASWLESPNDETAANALLLLIGRVATMLGKQLESQVARFKAEGGFREKLHTMRTETRVRNENAPPCPECGKPTRRQRRKADGSEFWGCTSYPECRKTQPIKNATNARSSKESSAPSDAKSLISSTESTASIESPNPPACPECAKPMALRRSARGSFWGCTGFREDGCKATRPISDQQKTSIQSIQPIQSSPLINSAESIESTPSKVSKPSNLFNPLIF